MYLNQRQARSIKNNFAQVPHNFSQKITLTEHQKSGHYTLAKLNLDNINNIISSGLLIFFTLGGAIEYIDTFIGNHIIHDSSISQGVILIFTLSIKLTI